MNLNKPGQLLLLWVCPVTSGSLQHLPKVFGARCADGDFGPGGEAKSDTEMFAGMYRLIATTSLS